MPQTEYSPTISAVAQYHLGKADDTNVYAAELTAIHVILNFVILNTLS
jgi:hypothetical protein